MNDFKHHDGILSHFMIFIGLFDYPAGASTDPTDPNLKIYPPALRLEALHLTAASLALRHSDRRVAAFLLPKLSGGVLLQEVVEVPPAFK